MTIRLPASEYPWIGENGGEPECGATSLQARETAVIEPVYQPERVRQAIECSAPTGFLNPSVVEHREPVDLNVWRTPGLSRGDHTDPHGRAAAHWLPRRWVVNGSAVLIGAIPLLKPPAHRTLER